MKPVSTMYSIIQCSKCQQHSSVVVSRSDKFYYNLDKK